MKHQNICNSFQPVEKERKKKKKTLLALTFWANSHFGL